MADGNDLVTKVVGAAVTALFAAAVSGGSVYLNGQGQITHAQSEQRKVSEDALLLRNMLVEIADAAEAETDRLRDEVNRWKELYYEERIKVAHLQAGVAIPPLLGADTPDEPVPEEVIDSIESPPATDALAGESPLPDVSAPPRPAPGRTEPEQRTVDDLAQRYGLPDNVRMRSVRSKGDR